MVAIGARAEWLVIEHPADDAYGAGSPLAKLVESDGQVLLLGAPLDTITLLHHAEAIAEVPSKGRVRYEMPMIENGVTVWREFHDIDTDGEPFPYEQVVGDGVDAFEVIAREALDAGAGRRSRVGEADCHLFDARALVHQAVAWIDRHFGAPDRGGR